MARWPAVKARRVFAALLRIGRSVKREAGGSPKVLQRAGWTDFIWSFHTGTEIARIANQTGLRPEDL